MIKVCMIVDKEHHTDGRIWRYVDALTDAGAQVDILAVRAPGQPCGQVRSGVRVFSIPIGRAHGGIGRYLVQYAAALVLFSARLLALYVRNRYEVIHVHNMPDFLVFAALIPRLLGARVILDVHDPMSEFFMTKFRNAGAGSGVLRLLRAQERLSAALAHAVITVNTEAKDILVRIGIPAGKIVVIRNLPDPRMFDRNKYSQERMVKGEHLTLIYPGTIAPQYGLDIAIRALPLLTERIPQIRLIIIGLGSEAVLRQLATLAEELGVSSLVQLRPPIHFSEVPRQLALADIGIYPALRDPYMNMATPSKALEYAAMGLPIIASRLASLEILFPESALMYCEPGDVQQFAQCVLALFDNPRRREEMVHNADTIFTRKLNWRDDRQVYMDLLSRLLAPREGVSATHAGSGG